jgi:hypothetical protein
MLPMTLKFSDYGGKEKVGTPTGKWDFTDAEGLNTNVGDFFSYKPWGNLGFFYSTEGNTFSIDLAKIGETRKSTRSSCWTGSRSHHRRRRLNEGKRE